MPAIAASSGLRIEHGCPQCGSPAVLEETDRVFHCGFCRVSSILLPGEAFRYLLPASVAAPEMLYFPYWRLRGTLYSLTRAGVADRHVDATLLAARAPVVPQSLGIRPQAMTLRFVTPETSGRFVRPAFTAGEAAAALAARDVDANEFIGETMSLIYAPYYVRGRLFDGVSGRAVGGLLPAELASGLTPASLPSDAAPPAGARFIPALCPRCGADLAAERDALVFTCASCASLWLLGDEKPEPVEFALLDDNVDASRFLPFWRLQADLGEMHGTTFADLVRMANLPRVVQKSWEEEPLAFWVPAFKIRPAIFLRLASAFTLAHADGFRAGELPHATAYPVTLPLSEATDSIRWILAHTGTAAELQVTRRAASLVYVPFHESSSELVNPIREIAVDLGALRLGMQL